MLDALVNGQDRHVAGAAETAVVEQRLEAAQHLGRAVGVGQHPVDEVRAGEVQVVPGDGLGFVR